VSEDPATVARAVALILDATPTPELLELPHAILELHHLRSATRRVIEADLPEEDERRLLRGLGRVAARCRLPLWAIDAITAELPEPEPWPVPPLSRESAAARLRRAGYGDCPVCLVPVPAEAEIEHWRRRRHRNAEDAATLAGAAPFAGIAL
jgi:hypothetical protein